MREGKRARRPARALAVERHPGEFEMVERFAEKLIWSGRHFAVAPSAHCLDVAGATALFCARTQKLSRFNESATLIWDKIAETGSPQGAFSELVGRGVPANMARDFVQQAVGDWLRSGHVSVCDATSLRVDETVCCPLEVGGVTIHLHGLVDSAPIKSVLAGFSGGLPAEIARYDLVEMDGVIAFFRDGAPQGARTLEQAAPQLKAMLADEYAARVGGGFLAHGALLAHGQDLLFLSGEAGVGKTTLSLALANTGFAYGADDLVHFDPNGHALGVCFPAAVKHGAWPLLGGFAPGLADAPIHFRGDGVRVRYYLPANLAAPIAKPVTVFVRLRRDGPSLSGCAPISGLSALCALLESGWSERHALEAAVIRSLATRFSDARCYELHYSDLREAVERVRGLLS